MTAGAYIDAALRDVLPEGVPAFFTAVESAHWRGRGRGRIAVGRLRMFDGQPATVEVWSSGFCTGHRFTEMAGGAASYEGARWVRVADIEKAPPA
ncbi:hypothetical protein [Brevundimonas sp.]|uniref:hypothetical protein n=1 Tax=Brevundimonas sp. TaxID=1871086 RepID=UPI002D3E06D5|nr:hypothetical protein [Brevundimonas sp.]HYC66627.1 hypothetical protein [Brevundimonas sp.]